VLPWQGAATISLYRPAHGGELLERSDELSVLLEKVMPISKPR
jgi:hypothetical protein